MQELSLFDCEKSYFKIDKPIRLIELFAGIGSQAKALERISADFEHYKISEWEVNAVGSYKAIHKWEDNTNYSEHLTNEELTDVLFNFGISTDGKTPMTRKQISRKGEKWKRTVYNNFKATNNIGSIVNVSASELGIVDTNKYCYIMTYSFPCQDLSLAGKQQGMAKGTNTRSSMLWEVERLLNECEELPQVLLMENVTQVHGKKNLEHFENWVSFLESKGYCNYWQDLNSKNFGIPQNRDRCIMVSILGNYKYSFPNEIPLTLRLKDLQEESVDEKYYLSPKMVDYILDVHNVQEGTKWEGRADADVLNPDIAHTLSVCGAGGNQRAGVSNFLIEGLDGEIQVDKLKIQYLAIDKTKNNPKIIDVANCITAREDRGISNRQKEGTAIVELSKNGLRIRKLTPKECFRLMGFDDADFEKAEAVNSNAQLYKQAGNSIVVDVLVHIFTNLLNINKRKDENQMSTMELKVKDFTLPEVVEFNFEELKEAVSTIAKKYEAHIYTEGQMTEAKKDLADLRKFAKALNDERIRLEREYMQPFQEFKDKINELITVINEPISSIDKQAKYFDEQTKEKKRLQIASFFEGCSPFEWLKFEQIFNPKWLNATVKIPAIEKEIEEIIHTIEYSLQTLADLPEFSFEATEVYKDTLDINKAISEGKRHSDMQKRKAEAECPKVVATANIDGQKTVIAEIPVEIPNKQWISFKALLSTEDAQALKNFFTQRNIEFKAI